MKKTLTTRLKLVRTTVRDLDPKDLKTIQGGMVAAECCPYTKPTRTNDY